ncbi:hypothetical protein [Pseudomonas syringae group genomosp. 3]|uniref:hypothetical protein n=1 Tax=Pseudomonas syringae group genomosp. 3 TaxID=251701 RepID=UPI0011C3556F|nr:hypothetical protein [Pseudomonas syringae group genomosp. 3]
MANLWPSKQKKPEPSVPDSPVFEEEEFTPTPNTELRLKSLNLTEDKVQRIFLDHAFRYIIFDFYEIKKIREKEMRDKDEFLPEELEQLKIEYQYIDLILEKGRKGFIAGCSMNHIHLLRKLAKTIIRLNPVIDKNKNPDLEVFWMENKAKELKPIDELLSTTKLKILYELIEAGILKEEDSKPVSTGTTDTAPPKIIGPDSEDIVMDSDSDKSDSKKSTLNFN